MQHWENDSDMGRLRCLDKNMPQCHLFRYKFQHLTRAFAIRNKLESLDSRYMNM